MARVEGSSYELTIGEPRRYSRRGERRNFHYANSFSSSTCEKVCLRRSTTLKTTSTFGTTGISHRLPTKPSRKILRAEPLRSHFQAEIKFHVCGSPTAIVGKFPLALSSPLFVQGLLFQSQLFNVRFFVCLSKQSSAPALKALRTKMESSSVC